jgi:hypothetical protein
MSTDRDTTRLVRSWLEEGVTALPDRVLDAVLDQVPATPQRRPSWPARRSTEMNRLALAAIAAAAVIAVAIVGYNMIPATGPGGPSGSTPPITHAPTASPGATPAAMIPTGAVPAGTYSISSYSNTRLEVTVPEGWTYEGGWLSKGDVFEGNGVVFTPYVISHVYGDMCKWKGSLRPTPTKAALVSALAAISTSGRGSTQDTLLGRAPRGYPAARIDFSLPVDADLSDCDDDFMRLWPDPGPDEGGGLPIHPGHSTTAWVIETAGKATALVSIKNETSDPAAVAELDAIMQSIWIPRS